MSAATPTLQRSFAFGASLSDRETHASLIKDPQINPPASTYSIKNLSFLQLPEPMRNLTRGCISA
jgi:hypothetical protein